MADRLAFPNHVTFCRGDNYVARRSLIDAQGRPICRPYKACATRFVLLAGLLIGCDASPPEPPRPPAATLVGSGNISGKVVFNGTAPPMEQVRNVPCCPGAPPTQRDETVVVNANGTLANVFVYLDGGPKVEGSGLAAPVLDQKFCQYTPHVIGVVVGQPLTLRSSDATYHNVNIISQNESAQNFSMQLPGETATTSFKKAGFAESRCDVHNWMKAHIGVFDNPFFAVTGGDGAFQITGVPDGDYTLITRHELYPPLSRPVTVRGGQAVNVDFRYDPRTP